MKAIMRLPDGRKFKGNCEFQSIEEAREQMTKAAVEDFKVQPRVILVLIETVQEKQVA